MARVEFNNYSPAAITVKGPHKLARQSRRKREHSKIAVQLVVQIPANLAFFKTAIEKHAARLSEVSGERSVMPPVFR
jgi:hypothetical protein